MDFQQALYSYRQDRFTDRDVMHGTQLSLRAWRALLEIRALNTVAERRGRGRIRLWDRCIDDQLGHTISDRDLSVWVGLDASIKHDSTAIVAVTWDQKAQHVRLVAHRVFQPTPEEPLDFEATIMRTLKDLHKRFWVRKVLYDPYQLVAIAQRLSRDGLPMEEFPQTPANLTAASQNLFDIIKGRNLVVYPDADIRFAISRTIATETGRGWRISKEKQAHKIDVVVALGMAAYAAVQAQGESDYILDYKRWAY